MLRKHENTVSWKAGLLALAVHVALLGALLISFNWKAAHPILNVTEVQLWDKVPRSNPEVAPPTPKPKPEIKEESKPKSQSEAKVEEKPKPDEPKADIELEKKKKLELEQKLAEEKAKKERELLEQQKKEALEKLKQEAREEQLREKKAEKEKRDEALRKLKEDMLKENGEADEKASSTANASVIAEYTDKIKAKIRGNVNKTLCGDGSPEIRVGISVLPTGQLSGAPRVNKSSGNAACDEAVERAIMASEPLPLPDDPALKSEFRNLNLKFRPND